MPSTRINISNENLRETLCINFFSKFLLPSFQTKKQLRRRRPATVVRALTSSNIAEKYNDLLDKRLNITDASLNEFKEKNDEHSKRMELLDLEIQIKKKQLNC